MIRIEALYLDDDVLEKIEGKHGLKLVDIEAALIHSTERCFHKVGGDQIRALLKTSSGQHVVAFLSHLEKGDWKLNSAREMTRKEKRIFKMSKRG